MSVGTIVLPTVVFPHVVTLAVRHAGIVMNGSVANNNMAVWPEYMPEVKARANGDPTSPVKAMMQAHVHIARPNHRGDRVVPVTIGDHWIIIGYIHYARLTRLYNNDPVFVANALVVVSFQVTVLPGL